MTELLETALDVARAATELIRTRRAAGEVEVAATKTSVTDIVTEIDRESERLVLGMLQDRRPNDGILGEEGTSVDGTSGINWVVDPIDGTVNFFYGIPTYAVSIAAVEGPADPARWHQLAGVVVNVPTGETFQAELGSGATCDGRSIRVADPVPLSQALVGTGFGYDPKRRAHAATVIADLLPRVRDIRRIGSAAIDVCYTASGRFNAYFERGLNPWDHAAAGLIAREAGAFVGGVGDAPPSNDLIRVGHPQVIAELTPHLVRLRAASDGD